MSNIHAIKAAEPDDLVTAFAFFIHTTCKFSQRCEEGRQQSALANFGKGWEADTSHPHELSALYH